MQSRYHEEIFTALIPTLRSSEPRYCSPPNYLFGLAHLPSSPPQTRRVHAHAAAAIINFCAGVDGETLQPYLEAIVQGLLGMLRSDSKRYVQEQAITTLAMVADAAADSFQRVSFLTLYLP